MAATLRRLTVGVLSCALITTVDGQEPTEWRITRELRIDAAQHDLTPITPPGDLTVGPNGIIAIGQNQDGVVRFFDATGRSLGSVGRKGKGPGEFTVVGRMVWLADTLAVIDGPNSRFTLISPNREFVRTVSMQVNMSMTPNPSADTPRYRGIPFNLGADGSFVLSVPRRQGAEAPPWPGGPRAGLPLVRVDRSGVFRNIIAFRPEISCTAPFDAGRGGQGFATIPFCAALIQENSSDGTRVTFSWVEEGSPPAYRVVAMRVNGDTLFNRRFTYRPLRISRATKDSVMAVRTRNPQIAQALANVKLPDTHPPVARVLIGIDETTWIEPTSENGDRGWIVLDAGGTAVASVKVPRNVRIMTASRVNIWAIETDDVGLQHVVQYRIQ